jgi:hypothetical protein
MATSIDRVPPGIRLKHLANLMKMLHTLLVFRRDPQPHFNSRTGALQLRSAADTDAARREIIKGGSCSTRKFDEGSLREWLIRHLLNHLQGTLRLIFSNVCTYFINKSLTSVIFTLVPMYSNIATLSLAYFALVAASASIGGQHTASKYCNQTQAYYPPAADCIEYNIPVSIEWENSVFNATRWSTDYDLIGFLSDATTRPSAGYPGVFDSPVLSQGTYNIAASFCTPKQTIGKEKTVVIGIGPAWDDWNSSHQPAEYNFVQFAIDQSYSVFYDRLGSWFRARPPAIPLNSVLQLQSFSNSPQL